MHSIGMLSALRWWVGVAGASRLICPAALIIFLAALLACRGLVSVAAAQPPEWNWRQVMSTPRVGGRLSAVAIDADDPRRIFLGTDEGTVLKSTDLGVTWMEYETDPVVAEADSFALIPPGLPELGATNPSPLRIFWDPPGAVYLDRVFVTGVQLVQFSAFPADLVVGFIPTETGVPQNLLTVVSRSSRQETEPVRQIALCPNGIYPVLVAGRNELFGSQDDGTTYVRLFASPGVELIGVVCSRTDPRLVYVASTYGMYRSVDGGQSFDVMMIGWPGAPATAVALHEAPQRDQAATLLAAWGSNIWAGDPDSERGLSMLYPDFSNSDTAPWSDIRWVSVSKDGAIWLATDEGIRASLDGGKQWAAVARSLFERNPIRQVSIGESETGGERIAVAMRDWVYASDDQGRTWHPYFHGISRRSFRWMTASPAAAGVPAGWWVATSGELWTTVAAEDPGDQPELAGLRRWARQQLQQTRPLRAVLDGILRRLRFSGAEIHKLTQRARRRALMPIFSASFIANIQPTTTSGVIGPTPSFSLERSDVFNWNLYFQGYWALENVTLVAEQLGGVQSQLTVVRNELMYAVEDIWHERVNLLRRLAAGEGDLTQSEVMRIRITTLETLLETWLREPVQQEASHAS